jgi:cation diffusion facilitator CzcD-associated flavoprotein CzcO
VNAAKMALNSHHQNITALDRSEKYCIIGAGSSGLVAGKNLKSLNIPFDILERDNVVGGLWNYGKPFSAVYRSTHLISSKPLTEYTDFPMPSEYPDYPNHCQVLEYMSAYARAVDLYPHIDFETPVAEARAFDNFWDVVLENGETRRYRGIIVANGHLWDAKFPTYPGHFDGISLHSRDYKTADVLRDKRVLVIGAGNSGCDIAVESAQNAASTFHSVRRGYHYVPKYLFGKPADQIGEASLKLRLPVSIRRAINGTLLRILHGKPENFGLPKPDHKLFETHPIINSQISYYLGHGDIIPKPDVVELRGDRVQFKNGSEEQIDVIIYATGFNIAIPFLAKEHLNWHTGHPAFYLNVFHPQYDNLFLAGFIQPDSGQWGLVDYQTQLIAKFIHAQIHAPAKATAFRKMKAGPLPYLGGRIRYLDSTRHYLEVEHFSYRQRLKKLIKAI